MGEYSNIRGNNRQRAIRMCSRAQVKKNWPTREDKIMWMEDMRKDLLEDLEFMIDTNFSQEESAYVRRLPRYRRIRRDIKHTKKAIRLGFYDHDGFYRDIKEFLEELGLAGCKVLGGLPGEEQPTGDRVAKLAAEHGRTVHGWIVHCGKVIDERNREAARWFAEHSC